MLRKKKKKLREIHISFLLILRDDSCSMYRNELQAQQTFLITRVCILILQYWEEINCKKFEVFGCLGFWGFFATNLKHQCFYTCAAGITFAGSVSLLQQWVTHDRTFLLRVSPETGQITRVLWFYPRDVWINTHMVRISLPLQNWETKEWVLTTGFIYDI